MKRVYRNVVVAMDSMKGCLDSYEASLAVAKGVEKAFPGAEVRLRPVSDGGEGMTAMVAYGRSDFLRCSCEVTGPLGEMIEAEWIMRVSDDSARRSGRECGTSDSASTSAVECDLKGRRTGEVYMDFASGAGITLVAEERRDPLKTTSYGVGEMIKAVVDAEGCGERHGSDGDGKVVVNLGLGGSGTVDGGLGALQALGLRLLDTNGEELPEPFIGGMLGDVADYELTDVFKDRIAKLRLTLLCDVEARFTGETGAARVFGPQKGADESGVLRLEAGMENLRRLILRKTGIDLNGHKGTGAAGGAAGGLMALGGGVIKKGASTLLDLTDFDGLLKEADLIVTGEGGSDRQTLMGKLPYEVLRHGQRNGVAVWLAAGVVNDREALEKAGFERVVCINDDEIVERSGTVGLDAMDPEVARRRLGAALL